MTFEAALRAKLLATGTITAITSVISPVLGRAGADKSADSAPTQIIFALEGREDLEFIDEPGSTIFPVYEINCVGRQENFDSLVTLAEAVEVALNGIVTGYGDVSVQYAQCLQVFDKVFDAEAGLIARALQFKFGYQR